MDPHHLILIIILLVYVLALGLWYWCQTAGCCQQDVSTNSQSAEEQSEVDPLMTRSTRSMRENLITRSIDGSFSRVDPSIHSIPGHNRSNPQANRSNRSIPDNFSQFQTVSTNSQLVEEQSEVDPLMTRSTRSMRENLITQSRSNQDNSSSLNPPPPSYQWLLDQGLIKAPSHP